MLSRSFTVQLTIHTVFDLRETTISNSLSQTLTLSVYSSIIAGSRKIAGHMASKAPWATTLRPIHVPSLVQCV